MNYAPIPCPRLIPGLFRAGRNALSALPLLALLITAGNVSAAAPANDDFVNADEITGSSGSIVGSNVDATKEGGEPNHGLNIGGTSVWYVWQAPVSGAAVFDSIGSAFDTTLGVYSGLDVDALTPVALGDDAFDYFPFLSRWGVFESASRVRFPVQAGVVYHIAVDGYNDAAPRSGSVNLSWQVIPRPANDNFANAQTLPGDTGFLIAENAGATKEIGERNHAGNSGGASIWFRWTPAVSGTARIFTLNSLQEPYLYPTPSSGTGTAMDTLLAVYTGASAASLTQISANDNNGANPGSLVNFTAQSGTTYWIALDGKNQITNVANGKIALTWTVGIAALNNSFANARVLTGKCGLVKGNNFSATKENGEPIHSGNPNDPGGSSVWFSWTAPDSGPTVFSALGSPFADTVMAVYTGNTLNGLTLVDLNDDANVDDNLYYSRIEFEATAGTTYRIALDGYRGNAAAVYQGVYFLSWGNALPVNDDFFSGEILNGSSGSVQGCNYNATRELDEPAHLGAPGHSIWYQWTPPMSGLATLSLESSLIDTVLAVYTGDGPDVLTLVAGNADAGPGKFQSRVSFSAEAGVVYRIAVDSVPFSNPAAEKYDGVIQLDYSLSTQPSLQITRSGSNITVTWEGPFRLQTADALATPSAATVWTDLPGASPVTLPINSAGNQFFRGIFP